MAAFIGWIDSFVGGTPIKVGKQGVVMGAIVDGFTQAWTKKTTDANGTIYFIAEINADAIIFDLKLYNDALSGATSADIGLFLVDPGLPSGGGPSATVANYYAGYPTSGTPSGTNALVDAGNIFMTATDISAGSAEGSARDALANLVVQTITTLGATTNGFLNYSKKIWELLGMTDPKWASAKYAIGLRLNTAGAATGNLVLRGQWIEG